MTKERYQRTIGALVSGGVVLGVILLSVIVYQIVKLGVQERRIEELTNQKVALERQLDEDENTLSYFQSTTGLETLIRTHGGKRSNK